MNRKIVKENIRKRALEQQEKQRQFLIWGALELLNKMEVKAGVMMYLSNQKTIN